MTVAQRPITTLTLNPALDVSARVDAVVAGPKLRLRDVVEEPGGGGVNVSRAIVALGGRSRALVALAGSTGTRHAALMKEAGVDPDRIPLKGETRQSLTVTDDAGAQFRFVLPGPEWCDTASAAVLEHVRTGEPGLVVLSGSQPPGLTDTFPLDLTRALGSHGQLVIDTSGPALQCLVRAPQPGAQPHVLRMDQAESEALAGDCLDDVAASTRFAQALVAAGVAELVIVARGADGSVLAGRGGTLHCAPPEVTVRSKVGAGDSFTAAFALSLARDDGLEQALAHGTAAAAAAVMTEASALCRAQDVARILPRCRLQRL